MDLPKASTVAKQAATGLAVGVAAGTVVATVMTFADWWQNPGGVFRGPDGTRWDAIQETWLSWFGPVALLIAIITLGISLILLAVRRGDD